MLRTAPVIRMLTRQRFALLGLPALNLTAAFLIVVGIGIAVGLAGGETMSMEEGMRWNGAIWAALGPLSAFGFGAMSQYFPLALGLGITRREFLAGTTIVMLGVAALFSVVVTVLKIIEVATDGWGVSVRMFSTVWLGEGPAWQTLVQSFLVVLMTFMLGAAITTLYARFGTVVTWLVFGGLAVLGLAGVGVLMVVGGAAVRFWTSVAEATWGSWMLVLAGITVVAATAWALMVRKAPVR